LKHSIQGDRRKNKRRIEVLIKDLNPLLKQIRRHTQKTQIKKK
jgi:hypothetical protein